MRIVVGLLLCLTSISCSDDSAVPPATADASLDSSSSTCSEGGNTYPVGADWACSDGCNSCHCEEGGSVLSTGEACGCMDGGRFFLVGQTWTCADGCNTCTCASHGMVSTTLVECDAGSDSGALDGSKD